MKQIGCIDMNEVVVVGKGDPRERDMYGGAVQLRLSSLTPDSMVLVSTIVVDLDPEAVEETVRALRQALNESAADYEVSHGQ